MSEVSADWIKRRVREAQAAVGAHPSVAALMEGQTMAELRDRSLPRSDLNQLARDLLMRAAGAIFGDDSDELIQSTIDELYTEYCATGNVTATLDRCRELEAAIVGRLGALTAENQRHVTLLSLGKMDISSTIKTIRDCNAKLAGSVEPLIVEKLNILQSANAFAAKLDDEGQVECPACGELTSVETFKAHVEGEQSRLRGLIEAYDERREAIGALIDSLKSLKGMVFKKELEEWRETLINAGLEDDLELIQRCDAELYRQLLTEDDLVAIEAQRSSIISKAIEASKNAPPDIFKMGEHKQMVDVAKSIFESKKTAMEIDQAEHLITFVNVLQAGIRDEIRERSEAVIGEISGDIRAMWQTLHPNEPIEDVCLYVPDEDKAMDIALRFYGKEQESPRLTLSEGYRNSLGLCIFLALAKREAASDLPLILDDVVVSLDRRHRGMIVALLESQFASRQVILLTHDRDWYAELRHQLDGDRWQFKSLLPYELPEIGIRWSDKTTSLDDARSQLKGRPDSAGNDARKVMDVELSLTAEKLQLKLPYLRGDRNDHRMWSDFLDRLVADGGRCLQKKSGKDFVCYTAGLDALKDAGRLLVTWANRSSHSADVERAEATKLIESCEKALAIFKCEGCSKPLWFADASNKEWVQCQCGDLRWRYGKG